MKIIKFITIIFFILSNFSYVYANNSFEEWKIKKSDAHTTIISAIELLKIRIVGIKQTHQDKNSEVIKILFLIIFS